MLTSLGFDTVAIHIDRFNSDIDDTIEFFYNIGIKNFLFVFDYNPLCDAVAVFKYRMKQFKNIHTKGSLIRIKIKCVFNLHISQGAGFNASINQLYAAKNPNTLLVSLPLFTDNNYAPIALDINNLLYKRSVFLIFSSFEKIVESSSIEFCSKFINNPKIGILADLNYLFNTEKEIIFNKLLETRSFIIPSISQEFANYAGALAASEFAINKYGKKAYYNICSQINKSTSIFFD